MKGESRMTYTICKFRKYRGGDVLESTVKAESLDTVLGLVKQNVLVEYAEVVGKIKRGVTGHHFIDDSDYTYQIVVK